MISLMYGNLHENKSSLRGIGAGPVDLLAMMQDRRAGQRVRRVLLLRDYDPKMSMTDIARMTVTMTDDVASMRWR